MGGARIKLGKRDDIRRGSVGVLSVKPTKKEGKVRKIHLHDQRSQTNHSSERDLQTENDLVSRAMC